MNRNDVVVPSCGESPKVLPSLSLPTKPSASCSGRSKKQTAFHSSVKTTSSCSKGILEERSVHLSLPSFHQKNHSGLSVWTCPGCSHENRSALSNECSICGMNRDVICDDQADSGGCGAAAAAAGAAHHPRWDEDISESSVDSFNSFMVDDFDGHASENSLSLHNSVLTDDREDSSKVSRDDDVIITAAHGSHASMPTSLLHQSFSERSVARSTRSNRSSRRSFTRGSNNSRSLRRQNSGDSSEGGIVGFDGNSSVMSFCNWDGNEKIQSWECTTCTFLNENPLHLMCEMCGTRRNVPNAPAAAPSFSQEEEEEKDDTELADEDYFEEEELYLLQQEQMRELVDIQRGILAEFGSRTTSAIDHAASESHSSFNTRELQREIAHVQASIPSNGRPRLDYSSMDCMDCDDEGKRLTELLAAQKDIMKDFKMKRTDNEMERLDVKPAALRSPSSTSSSSSSVRGISATRPNESIFGSNAPNVAPSPTCFSLKDSMRAAGGQLRHEDLTLPLLWGDNDAGSLKKEGGPGKNNRR